MLAQNTVRVRDSVANPFVAQAGGKLLVQGNQNVDIFALNHPNSGLVSGGDMVLRSTNAVGGNAHYWTRGNFRIEQLNGSVGDLFSPYDPIIRAVGNVNLGGYTGNSLHILAGGSVNIEGNVTIGGIETGTANVNYIVETVPLSVALPDGTVSVNINGNREPTLDIRAGVNWASLGGLAENTLSGAPAPLPPPNPPFLPPQPPQQVFDAAQGANIRIAGTVSNLSGAATGSGQIFLTNQYPNPSSIADTSIIQTGDIFTYGSATIDSRGAITTGKIDTSATQPNQNGGDIRLIANGSITTNGDLLSQVADNTGVNGLRDDIAGNITLRAGGDINTRNVVAFSRNDTRDIQNSNLFDNRYSTIRIESTDGSVFIYGANVIAINIYSQDDINNPGYAGDIIIDAGKDIRITNSGNVVSNLQGIEFRGIESRGLSGRIVIGDDSFTSDGSFAKNVFVTNSSFISAANDQQGNAGLVAIRSSGLVNIDTSYVRTTATKQANGGDIEITTKNLNVINGGQLDADINGLEGKVSSVSKAGNITITASDSVLFSGFASRSSSSAISNQNSVRNGGGIKIYTGSISMKDGAGLLTNAYGGQGTGGNIEVHARDTVLINGVNQSGYYTSIQSDLGTVGFDGEPVAGQGGKISIEARSVEVSDGAFLSSRTKGRGNGGEVRIDAIDSVVFKGVGNYRSAGEDKAYVSSAIYTNVDKQGVGKGGAIIINVISGALHVTEGAILSASTSGSGDSGNVEIYARDAIFFDGRDIGKNNNLSGAYGTANSQSGQRNSGGNFTISTGSLNVTNGAQVSVRSRGQDSNSGNIIVNAGSITLNNQAALIANNDGTISSTDFGNVTLQGIGEQPLVSLQVTNSLISASTQTGRAGSIKVAAKDFVQLTGIFQAIPQAASNYEVDDIAPGGGLLVRAISPSGTAGNLAITTQKLMVQDRAQVSASNISARDGGAIELNGLNSLQVSNGNITASTISGKAGNLNVNVSKGQTPVDFIELAGLGGLFVSADKDGGGTAGSLTVNANRMVVRGGAVASVSSETGQAGNLNITANYLTLNAGKIIANSGANDPDNPNQSTGNINLQGSQIFSLGKDSRIQILSLENESKIVATAGKLATGGNINIAADFVFGFPPTGSEGSDISANADLGKGGIVKIARTAIFGLTYRPKLTPLNDITATSNAGLQGTVTFTGIDVDPTRGLSPLPIETRDPSNLIDQSCSPGSAEKQTSQYTNTGRGGLPPSPDDPLNTDTTLAQLATPVLQSANRSSQANSPPPDSKPPHAIVEAQGWMKLPNGRIRLVTQATTVTPHGNWQPPFGCSTPQGTKN